MGSYQYKAFISYSHRDAKWAKWLHDSLENYKIHKHLIGEKTDVGVIPDKLAPVFLDRAELASATDLGTLLKQSLENSWCQIVICSRTSAQSHWVNEEIKTFKRLGRAHRIFSLIVDGEPYASGTNEPEMECFPPALRFQLDEQGEVSETPAEPIAADARKGKDGKSNALIKIIAGMLGVGFDALKQRELQRRHRRLAWLTTSACVGMVLAIGLAVNAFLARNEAERQRVRAQIEAETANRTANFMVSLFSVSDPSEARGNTITAREILDNGAKRIDSELTDQPIIQTNLMNTIGEVYTALGLYQQAENLLKKTVDQRLTLFASAEIGAEEMAESQGALAKVLTELSNLDNAVALYDEAIPLVKTNTTHGARLMSELIAGKAEAFYRLGKYSEAEPLLQRVVWLKDRAYGVPSLEVADGIQQVGLNRYDLGDLDGAISFLERSLFMFEEVLGDQPHPALAENIGNLAYLLHSKMDFEQAEIKYKQALDMYTLLLGDAHPSVATAAANLAFLYHDFGKYDEAKVMYQQTIDTLKKVYGPSHPAIAKAMNNLAYLLKDMGDNDAAVAMMNDVVSMAEKELGESHTDVGRYLSTQGRWLAESGSFKQAAALHRRALAIKEATLEPGHPDIAISQFDLAEALTGTGKTQEAEALARASVDSLVTSMGEDHWYVAVAKSVLGQALVAEGKLDEAEPLLLASYKVLTTSEGVQPTYIRKALTHLIELYSKQPDQSDREKYAQLLAELNNNGS